MVVLQQVLLIARRSFVRTMRQPGVFIPPLVFPLMLMAVNSNGLAERPRIFPGSRTRVVSRLLRAVLVHAGRAFRLWHCRHRSRARHRHRLSQPARADADSGALALLLGHIGGAARARRNAGMPFFTLGVALAAGVHIDAGVGGAAMILVLAVLIAAGFGTPSGCGSRSAPARPKGCSRSFRCSSSSS